MFKNKFHILYLLEAFVGSSFCVLIPPTLILLGMKWLSLFSFSPYSIAYLVIVYPLINKFINQYMLAYFIYKHNIASLYVEIMKRLDSVGIDIPNISDIETQRDSILQERKTKAIDRINKATSIYEIENLEKP